MAENRYETLLANYRNAWAGLRMIREAVETLGPPGVLPSGEAVISLYGPEPIHEAEAIVDALGAILGDEPDPGTQSRNLVDGQEWHVPRPHRLNEEAGRGP